LVATADRLFPLLLGLLIVAGGFFGIGAFFLPTQFASLTGFAGQDPFAYRIAGAASTGYAVGFAVGYRASWDALRIPIAATAVFNLASIVACIAAIVAGGAQPLVFVILPTSIVFSAACLFYLRRPPRNRATYAAASDHPLAAWVMGLFVLGTIAALFFGLVTLVAGGAFGRAVGAPGLDDFVYRQGGAATLGAGIGGALVLVDRRWSSARIPTFMAVTFNGMSVIAALLDIAAGTAQPITYLILAAAGLVTVGSLAALWLNREGRTA
jgi:hypothetical protein